MPSPGAGVIEELLVADGGKVNAGQQLFKLRLTGSFLLELNYACFCDSSNTLNFQNFCFSKTSLFQPFSVCSYFSYLKLSD